LKKILLTILSIACIASATPLFDRCGTCHGKKGERHSLNLTKPIAGMKEDDIVKILTEYKAGNKNIYGFGKMMNGQTSKLSDSDIKIIASYVASFPPVKNTAIVKAKKVKSGEELYRKCAVCHGEKAEKSSLGVSKIIAGWDAKELIKVLKEYRATKRDTYGRGNMMNGQASKLSDKEINAVAKYISSLSPIKQSTQEKKKPKRKITQEEVDYNTFMDEYFKNSKNPNETFEAAKESYKKHQQKLKEKNE